uniref:Tyrosine-protein kinase receptor TYRO3 n=1 Tax=Salmo trutta TaxID=8032 RepID=A0A674F509_SALTR
MKFHYGLLFTKNPTNLTVTQGNMARLGCCIEGLSEPEIVWMKDGEKLYSTDQMYIPIEQHHWETFHRSAGAVKKALVCVPHLTCLPPLFPFPVGVNNSIKFYCEARNARGISVSRTGTVHIKVLPAAPKGVQVVHMVENNVTLAWSPGFTGHSDLSACTIQMSKNSGRKVDLLDQRVKVPPFQQFLSGLSCYSNYSVRVCCDNEVGTSLFSGWLDFQTPEAVPSAAPRNLTFDLTEQQLSMNWATLEDDELQGKLMAYKVQWNLGGEGQEALFFKENVAHLSGGGRFFNATFQVSACTVAGCGPWSQPVLVMPASALAAQMQRGHMWVGLLLGLLVATMVGLLLTVLVHRRGKETQFGSVFKPPGNERLVSFTAARSFNRTCPELPESSLDSLGISNDLKAKLQDVLIPERLLTLGHMLGKGEFGSVREAFLKMEDSTVQKVAVKVLKTDINSSCDIEQCLKEASYMKDFDHPNVIQLIGVSLHSRPQQRLPIPMVILPFMKHGDLHTFLLLSRLGDEPFTVSLQMLIQFMLDIARGMAYLSNKSIIHRDLAARNCMLSENLTVCVADFGLSKKIYSGDYYRQGSVSKLPVKWIALESLADNVYTTQSDVWAFGVTMWEIMARGQTPYPGVENSEIYEYLIKGERLKQPPDCRDDIYEIMHSCWSPVPKCRPSFLHLIDQLEGLWASLSPGPSCIKEALLYVNLENDKGEQGAGALGPRKDPSWSGMPWQSVGVEEDERDWLAVSSGAALVIGGDYRYIIGPTCNGTEEEDGGRQGDSMDTLQQEVRDEDAFINV